MALVDLPVLRRLGDELVPECNETAQTGARVCLEDLVDVAQAARLLHCSKSAIRAWVRDAKLRKLRVGARVLLSRTDLTRFVERSTQDQEG